MILLWVCVFCGFHFSISGEFVFRPLQVLKENDEIIYEILFLEDAYRKHAKLNDEDIIYDIFDTGPSIFK
jgi:hypothetical protein